MSQGLPLAALIISAQLHTGFDFRSVKQERKPPTVYAAFPFFMNPGHMADIGPFLFI